MVLLLMENGLKIGRSKIQNKLVMVGGIVNMEKDVNWQQDVTVFRILVRKMLTAQMLDI